MGRVTRAGRRVGAGVGLTHLTRKTSSYAEREIYTNTYLHSDPLSPRGVALRGRPPRRLFECQCDQCQGYATDDPDEPDLGDDGGDAGDAGDAGDGGDGGDAGDGGDV